MLASSLWIQWACLFWIVPNNSCSLVMTLLNTRFKSTSCWSTQFNWNLLTFSLGCVLLNTLLWNITDFPAKWKKCSLIIMRIKVIFTLAIWSTWCWLYIQMFHLHISPPLQFCTQPHHPLHHEPPAGWCTHSHILFCRLFHHPHHNPIIEEHILSTIVCF